MPIFQFDERPNSRAFSAKDKTETRIYKAVGEQDSLQVQAYALGATPAFIATAVGTLYRQDVKLDPDGFSQYVVTVPYAAGNRQNGSYTFDFDATGATIKIKAAKEHVQSYPTAGNPHKASIGVTSDGKVEGADIIIPALKFTITFSHPSGVVTIPFARLLSRAAGHTNLNAYLSHDPGELLFLGATGSDGSEAEAQVKYMFASSENVTDLSFGDITDIVKQGHQLAWVEFKDEADAGAAVVQPKAVHIERVYDPLDFLTYFGWG